MCLTTICISILGRGILKDEIGYWDNDKSNGRNSHFIWKVAWFHHKTLAGLELDMQTRMVLNSHRFTSICLPTAGNKIGHRCDRIVF